MCIHSKKCWISKSRFYRRESITALRKFYSRYHAIFQREYLWTGFESRFGFLTAIIVASLLTAGFSRHAATGGWDQLPDGRAVIQVGDVRLALPGSGSNLDFISFMNQEGRSLLLREVISLPNDARRFFAEAKNINVRITNGGDSNELFLGNFDRAEFRSFLAGISIGAGASIGCREWERIFAKVRAEVANSKISFGPDGWAESINEAPPVSRAYIRNQTDGEKDFFPGMSCNELGSCSEQKCIRDDVAISYTFAEKIMERSKWKSFEARAGDVFKFVLIDLIK